MSDVYPDQKCCVLAVDDDPITLEMLALGMPAAGYELMLATSAEQALEMVAQRVPDIALLDITLPGMSGIELAKHLRQHYQLPFLFLSAHRAVDIVREATQNGAVGYLVKPINVAQIIPAVEAGLARAAEISQLRRIEATLTAALSSGSQTNDVLLQELEQLVTQRTRQLAGVNALLSEDRSRRQQAEAELLGRYAELTDLNLRLDRAEERLQDQQDYDRELRRMANEDALTALPNRHWFKSTLPDTLARAHLAQHMLALLFIDLDDFKNINDTMGHAAGDALLCEVAQRLRAVLRPSDHVVRLGGDEFTIILDPVESVATVSEVAKRIINTLLQPFDLLEGRNTVGASIGITLFPRDGEDAETLLKNSDIAMYHAKALGKGGFCFFQPELYENLKARLDTERALAQALEQDQFVLFYEPRVCSHTGELRGLEALVRWRHPQRGLVQPAQFIALAESSGLILKLGEVVLELACRQLVQWREQGLPLVPLSINVSARQFNHGDVKQLFAACLERHNLTPQMVEIELTESSMMGEQAEVAEQLHALKRLGIKLMVDDFGTGFSSLSQLQRLDMDVLKVDRSFTSQLGHSNEGEIFFNAIVSMAHALGMQVVAEGVETAQQLAILQTLDCDQAQGYFIARAIPPELVPDLLRKRFLIAAYAPAPAAAGLRRQA